MFKVGIHFKDDKRGIEFKMIEDLKITDSQLLLREGDFNGCPYYDIIDLDSTMTITVDGDVFYRNVSRKV